MDTVAIMVVIQLPPRLSLSTDVIIEFLYGMCERFFSERAMMTCRGDGHKYPSDRSFAGSLTHWKNPDTLSITTQLAH